MSENNNLLNSKRKIDFLNNNNIIYSGNSIRLFKNNKIFETIDHGKYINNSNDYSHSSITKKDIISNNNNTEIVNKPPINNKNKRVILKRNTKSKEINTSINLNYSNNSSIKKISDSATNKIKFCKNEDNKINKNHSIIDRKYPQNLNVNETSLLSNIIDNSKNYSSIVFNKEVYHINDFLIVSDLEDNSVCKLTKIFSNNQNNVNINAPNYWPSIEVQWYYKKKDINKTTNNLSNKKYNSLSEYEVFKSDHKDVIFIESIISKCQVYSFEKYESLEYINNDNVFFCRAGYDPIKKKLIPNFDSWKKDCKCNLPLNPDQLYINCDICKKWYHPECFGYDKNKLDNVKFECDYCLKQKI